MAFQNVTQADARAILELVRSVDQGKKPEKAEKPAKAEKSAKKEKEKK
jgi:hypothetical protein